MKRIIFSAIAETIELPIPENNHTAIARALAETINHVVFEGVAEAHLDNLPATLQDTQQLLHGLEVQVYESFHHSPTAFHYVYEYEHPESVMGLGYKDIIIAIAGLKAKMQAIQKAHECID